MNITRFTFSIALLSSVAALATEKTTPAETPKSTCAHGCTHHDTPAKSVETAEVKEVTTKKVEIAEFTATVTPVEVAKTETAPVAPAPKTTPASDEDIMSQVQQELGLTDAEVAEVRTILAQVETEEALQSVAETAVEATPAITKTETVVVAENKKEITELTQVMI